MSHVANCIKELTDKDDKCFEAAKGEVSHCVNYIDIQQKDLEGKVITDRNGNEVLSQVMVVTNAEDYEIAKELQKQKTIIKEDERQKFVKDKELLLGIILGQVDPAIKQHLNNLPEYEQIKEDHDLIGTMKCLQNICYTNKDGEVTYSNIKQKK